MHTSHAYALEFVYSPASIKTINLEQASIRIQEYGQYWRHLLSSSKVRNVLPHRIQLLSEALGDLYKEFNSLKERLTELTARFDYVESFVDATRSGRKPPPPGAPPKEVPARPRGRKSKVLVRRIFRPSQDWPQRIRDRLLRHPTEVWWQISTWMLMASLSRSDTWWASH